MQAKDAMNLQTRQGGPMGRGRGRGGPGDRGRFGEPNRPGNGPGGMGPGGNRFGDRNFQDETQFPVPAEKCGLVIGKGET